MEFEIREVRTVAQGRGRLVRERGEYFRLMDQRLTGYEACRIVGVNYRTGKRLGVLTWSPLNSGWLTGRFRRGEPVELTAFRKAVACTSGGTGPRVVQPAGDRSQHLTLAVGQYVEAFVGEGSDGARAALRPACPG